MTSSSLNEDLDGRCDQELVRIPGGGIRIGSVENGTFALPVLQLFPREVLPVASRGLVIGRRQAGNDQKPRIQTAAEVRLVDEHSPTPERVPVDAEEVERFQIQVPVQAGNEVLGAEPVFEVVGTLERQSFGHVS